MSHNPFKDINFSRIPNNYLSNEFLSDGSKIVLTFLGGQFGLSKNGKMDFQMEEIAKAVGVSSTIEFDKKTGFIKTKIPTRQTERNVKSLKDLGIIDTKKLKHGIRIWFKNPDTTNLTGLIFDESQDTTNLTGLKEKVFSDPSKKNQDPTNMTPSPDKYDESGRSYHNIKKKRKLGAAPDFYLKNRHPYLEEIISALPISLRYKNDRDEIDNWLYDHDGDRPYLYWLIDTSDSIGYFRNGLKKSYSAYFHSDDYEIAGAMLEFKSLEPVEVLN